MNEQEVCNRLLAQARRQGIQFGLVLTWYIVERFVHRLEQSGQRDTLLLDGDLLIHALAPQREPVKMSRSDPPAKPAGTADDGQVPVEWRADLLWRPARAHAALAKAFADVCRVAGGDYVRFDRQVQVSKVMGSRTLSPQFEVVVTGVLNGITCSVSMRVTPDAYRQFAARDVSFPRLIGSDKGTRPNSCTPEVFMARMVRELWDAGVAHLSPGAYADLHRLIEAGQLADRSLAIEALAAVFRDAKPEFPPNLPLALAAEAANDPELARTWSAYCTRARRPTLELSSVIGDIASYMEPLLNAARSSAGAARAVTVQDRPAASTLLPSRVMGVSGGQPSAPK